MFARVRRSRAASAFDGVIVLHGASIPGNTPDGGNDVAVKLAALLPKATVFIASIGNATFTSVGGVYDLSANFSNDVDAHFQSGRRNRVYVGGGAELDEIDDHGGTASSTHSSAASYVTTAKSFRNGAWEVWVCSCIDTTENTATNPPDLSSIRSGYNALIAADYAGGSGYANLMSRPELQNASDTTYFYDGIHLKDAGRSAYASYLAGIP